MPTPGVGRPMNLVDVLGALSGQATSAISTTTNSGGSTPGIGVVAEADDPITPITDGVTDAVTATPTWDNASWNAFVWS